MPGEILGEVANLLEEALNSHSSIRAVVLCTREGVVVASVSRDDEIDPTLLSTVSAALVWASITTMGNVGSAKPTYLIQSTPVVRILTVLQHHFQLVVVISRADDSGILLEKLVPNFQSIGTRVEILMSSREGFKTGTVLGRIVEAIPDISQAMVLTSEGLPISSVGFQNDIEMAALIGSIFANGLTYSDLTDTIYISSNENNVIVQRIDEQRLLAVVCKGDDSEKVCVQVRNIIENGV
jgi:predicted regulator of Ras-like GTPase activity (Roadblock/LC7/MglB family)